MNMILEKIFNLKNNFSIVLEKLDLLLGFNEQNDYNEKLNLIINKINKIEIRLNNLQTMETKSEIIEERDLNFVNEKKYTFDEVEKFIPENNSKLESNNVKIKSKKSSRKLDVDKLSNIFK